LAGAAAAEEVLRHRKAGTKAGNLTGPGES
jgi:hypothetical protein